MFFKKNDFLDLLPGGGLPFGMSRTALLPHAAPFSDEDTASLNRVLGSASPLQRAWLAGFLAGLDAQSAHIIAPEASAQPDAGSRPSSPLTILFASESGNAEQLAQKAAKIARKSGFKPKIIDFSDLDPAELAKERQLLVIAATWGEGEPPSRAIRAYNALMGETAPRLEGVKFGVLALGDTAYVEFCAIGKALDARLAELGATRAIERIDCDLDFEAAAGAWIEGALETFAPEPELVSNVIPLNLGAVSSEELSREPVLAEVSEHVNLNSSRSDKETIHLALSFDGAAPAYEPGDSLEIYPQNDLAAVDSVLAATGLSGDERLRVSLASERDITTLSLAVIEKFAAATGHREAKRIIADGEARSWIEGRQLIDLLESCATTLTADQLLALTRPLPPRAYSIASSRKEVGNEAHLLVSAVRYESHGRPRVGVASTHMTDRLKVGSQIRVRVKPNKHFRLPDPSKDIIMIGPGTGVAPFRAFVQERRAAGASGRNWLFFGDRRYTHDFLYQLEWQDALADGSLHRLDVAFSRDAPRKVYVQNRLWERRRDVVDWLDNGASLYVCGDAKAMAKDVRSTLADIFADVKALSADHAASAVAALERDRRYLQDVY
jgi:sulfite reductase (NADPH) flavoprotein alpha-component